MDIKNLVVCREMKILNSHRSSLVSKRTVAPSTWLGNYAKCKQSYFPYFTEKKKIMEVTLMLRLALW